MNAQDCERYCKSAMSVLIVDMRALKEQVNVLWEPLNKSLRLGCHTEFPIPDRIAGWNGDHLGRTVQRQGTAGFLLLVHEIASLYSLSYSQ